jgi:hypothetical protein
MRTRVQCLLAFALFSAPFASAQSTTADGIGALARGDTAAAFRILRPLADSASNPDPVAQFFLAAVYDGGLGGNRIRACGLYLKSAIVANPLASQARLLADAIGGLGPRMPDLCSAAGTRAWGEPLPARFVLGPDHVVAIDAAGFVIRYRGTERSAAIDPGGLEWVFLPTRYTRLQVARPGARARHFIEFFSWSPDDPLSPRLWSLSWCVYEVVESEIHVAAFVLLAYVAGDRPPADYPVNSVARLRINGDGEVEAVASGPNLSTSVIRDRGRR